MKKKYLITFIILLLVSSVNAQKYNMFKALYIYNFAKNIDWPTSYNTQNFVIGVYGNSQIITELYKISKKKKVNNKTILVKKINSIDHISNLNILYIPINKSLLINKIVNKTKNKPILIITESHNFANKGSSINFILIEGNLKFEINKSIIRKHNLKVNNTLLKLGILY